MGRTPLEKSLAGPAGEHFVLYQLYRRGILAALAPPATPTVDILVLDVDGDSVVATLQVKTRTTGRDGGWHMRDKHEKVKEERLFYALVDLEVDPPVTYILPSKEVAEALHVQHQAWLRTPGKGGRSHKDTSFRRLRPSYPFEVPGYESGWLDQWKDRWDLILEAATERS